MDYFKANRHSIIIDPTPEKRYLHAKAYRIGLNLSAIGEQTKPSAPPLLLTGNYKNESNGWTKILDNLPPISNTEIDAFHINASRNIMESSTTIKKVHKRGEQFLQEKYIDNDTVFTKQNVAYFFLKGKCSASKKKLEYNLSLAIAKTSKEIAYAFCDCPSGNGGLCHHCFAFMTLVAGWSVKRLTYVPNEAACTAQPCQWSQRKTIAHLDQKQPLSNIPMKRKVDGSHTYPGSRLYEARVQKATDLQRLMNLTSNMAKYPIGQILQNTMQPVITSKFGNVPIGSPLSYQCPMFNNMNVTCSFEITEVQTTLFINYPKFPINVFPFVALGDYVENLDSKSQEIFDKFRIDFISSERIENDTQSQAVNNLWHSIRKHRFTASKNYDFKNIKTSKGFTTFANKLISPQAPSSVMAKKFEYGQVNEPIALKQYDDFFKSHNHSIDISSCGVVIPPNACILGASPDAKVIDPQEEDVFGLVEIKCPQQYCDFDAADIAQVQPNFCLQMDNGKIKINKNHQYYDQVIMQMAITGTKWCDFVVYCKKGMVIDRVRFDHQYWLKLQKRIYDFYFTYYLPCLVNL